MIEKSINPSLETEFRNRIGNLIGKAPGELQRRKKQVIGGQFCTIHQPY